METDGSTEAEAEGEAVKTMIEKLLVANRGEIAVRIFRTCRRLGIPTVAVYSEADRHAPHVRSADEARLIGPAEAQHSYLDGSRIVGAAKAAGATAIHPGYGFLSENADFAELCSAAGIAFVGPHAKAIRDMGSKIRARRLCQEVGVPVIPGYDSDEQDSKRLVKAATKIGFPIMIKASAGGGGRGIRIVSEVAEFQAALEIAQREALSTFKSDEMIVEKHIARARHIEVQVVGDKHGNVIHLFDRDCSIQRRHQKIIEEAPAPRISQEQRDELYGCALKLARAIGYDSAGTMEFLLDCDSGEIYFLEMNTRLQVEHPVTEAVTGLDLVELQLVVAAGEPLPISQSEVTMRGCAIEARVNAEEPAKDFQPATGPVRHYREPQTEGIRVDSGITEQSIVTPHYDSLLAKVVASGSTRESARRRLASALSQMVVAGVENNLDYLRDIVTHSAFQEADLSTGFLPTHLTGWKPALSSDKNEAKAAAVAFVLGLETSRNQRGEGSPWHRSGPWRLLGSAGHEGWTDLVLKGSDSELHSVRLTGHNGEYKLKDGGNIETLRAWSEGGMLCVELDGALKKYTPHVADRTIWLTGPGHRQTFHVIPREELTQQAREADLSKASDLIAPWPGLITEVPVKPGDEVQRGDELVVMEAMKMFHHLRAEEAGTVEAVHCKPQQSVMTSDLLIEFVKEPQEPAEA